MKLVSWNVNGLRSILQKGLGSYLESCGADVVCLQEIKAKPEQVDLSGWSDGWEMLWNPAPRPGYSGTAMLVRAPVLGHSTGIGDPEHDGEGRVLTAEYPSFYLVNVYVPNSKRELNRLEYRTKSWGPAFQRYLKKLERRKPVVVCGDMNVAHREIDLARPKDNTRNAGFTPEERESFQALLDVGFVDTFRVFEKGGGHYTWWSYQSQARTRNIGWRIDYFLVSEALLPELQSAAIQPEIPGSDHCPVVLELSV